MVFVATAVAGVVLMLAGAAPAAAAELDPKKTFTGKATFSEDYSKPDLGFDNVACPKSVKLPKLPKQLMTGLNKDQFGKGENCGVIVEVTGKKTKKKVKVQIVDRAVGPANGSLNLDKAAFSAIGNVDDGILDITWTVAK